MAMVAKTIGTIVSFAWETEPGVRPTTGYQKWCDCTAHPNLNPEADQIETTTLCQTHNHTYDDGLVDFGTLEFGANLTTDTYTLFLDDVNGLAIQYPEKASQGLRLWVCVDIKDFPKSYYIPVKPQPFGLPEGEAGSNKYDLIVRFSVTGDAGWYDDPIYSTETTYNITITGYALDGVQMNIMRDNSVIRSFKTVGTSMVIALADGVYKIVASFPSNESQVQDLIAVGATTITFDAFQQNILV